MNLQRFMIIDGEVFGGLDSAEIVLLDVDNPENLECLENGEFPNINLIPNTDIINMGVGCRTDSDLDIVVPVLFPNGILEIDNKTGEYVIRTGIIASNF